MSIEHLDKVRLSSQASRTGAFLRPSLRMFNQAAAS